MNLLYFFSIILYSLPILGQSDTGKIKKIGKEDSKAERFLQNVEKKTEKLHRERTQRAWDFSTNMTDENQRSMVDHEFKTAKFIKNMREEAASFDLSLITNAEIKSKIRSLSSLQTSVFDDTDYLKFQNITAQMQRLYYEHRMCSYKDKEQCHLNLYPDILTVFRNSRNPEKLKHYWLEWYGGLGSKLRPLYIDYVRLKNKWAKAHGLQSAVELWIKSYGNIDFLIEVEKVWMDVQPIYQQLHAFVRRKLYNLYGKDVIDIKGPIPAHLLGDPWAMQWTNILDFTRPFPNKSCIDVTKNMRRQKFTVIKMFKLAENFFTSIGLIPMPQSFWDKSMFEKPHNRKVACQASSWNFGTGDDVRIKMCAQVCMDDFITIHHEMGHIEYYLHYADLPMTDKHGANPGFHEAIGDTISLSVSTPEYLKAAGLLQKEIVVDKEMDLNFLFNMASQKLSFLPFGLLLEIWRYEVFEGITKPKDYNTRWWQLRRLVQGVKEPLPRSPDDFDAGPKFHVVSDNEFLRYFVAHILQFQFHKALCIEAGKYKSVKHVNPQQGMLPLHRCSIHNSKRAGKLLSNMLSAGSSKPWRETLKAMTGSEKLDAGPLKEYFQPLITYLTRENWKNRKEG